METLSSKTGNFFWQAAQQSWFFSTLTHKVTFLVSHHSQYQT